ncbi:hypothetical protein [Edaphobacter modestus]|uniref:Uncharacterized protein n=1 Tax=Edaphobacter modestus TaxID=388466 RepID=A0A4Q7YXZ0_9BACT|nr:hypothetical protein [Edaphobacter modestus]RZU41969.1 hypothetical protein BDD14_3511 [Edaphobacter modestus]
MPRLPVTEAEIDAFLAAFEGCTLPKTEWTHSAHLLTGACYVHGMGHEAALAKMRHCVRRYNESVGGQNTATSGYHESITVMWIRLLDRLHRESAPMDRAQFAALAVERFAAHRDIFREYYDFDLTGSTEARLRWVEPTLKPLE